MHVFQVVGHRHHLAFPHAQAAIGQQAGALGAARAPGEAVGIRLADFDPMQNTIIQAFFPQGRFVYIRQATPERQLLVVPKGVGQQAHSHALFGFRRVAGDGLFDALVHRAVEVGEVEFEFVGRGRLGHERASKDKERRPV